MTSPKIQACLSVREPWAWAIVANYKSIENRTWNTARRGAIAIHAASTDINFADSDRSIETEVFLRELHPDIDRDLNDLGPLGATPLFQFGAIVGTAEIIGCIDYRNPADDIEELIDAAGFRDWRLSHEIPPGAWAEPGGYCFLLTNARQFQEPFAARGMLNFWQLTGEQQKLIAAQLAKPCASKAGKLTPVEAKPKRQRLPPAATAGKAKR